MIATSPKPWSRVSGLLAAMVAVCRKAFRARSTCAGASGTSHFRRLLVLVSVLSGCLAGLLALNFGCAQRSLDTDQFFSAAPPPRREIPTPSKAPAATPRPLPRQPSGGSTVPAQNSLHPEPSVILVPWNGRARGGEIGRHTAGRGETLAGLARQYYGDPGQWRVIYQANRDIIRNPNNLPAGIRLHIPRLPLRNEK